MNYSEWAYARFCRRFERRLTEEILRRPADEVVVLANDVSEGPNFAVLAEKGYPIYTIYHVDVVDYFTTIYLRSWLKPERSTAIFRALRCGGLSGWVPSLLRLIWQKQEDSVRFSRGLIVPSQRMKELLERCYPQKDPSAIHVLPWGVWEEPVSAHDVELEKDKIRAAFPTEPDSAKLLLMSRISPEKGQDRLLKALALWEKRSNFPTAGVTVYLAGEAAYMMGKRYARDLRRRAATLKRSRVHFVGYVSGARKRAFFEMSDLYVFPSRHESYGLTLLEALRAGLPVLATPSHGARDVFQPGFGDMTPPAEERRVPELLMKSLHALLKDRLQLRRMGENASAWAGRQHFSAAAAKLGELLLQA